MSMQLDSSNKHLVVAATLLAALMVFLFAYTGATASDETVTATIGTPLTIELEGNPSTGYTWEYQLTGASANFIKIDSCGWREKTGANKKLMGRSKIYHCQIMPIHPGEAEISFVYRRPWEKSKPAKSTRIYNIKIE